MPALAAWPATSAAAAASMIPPRRRAPAPTSPSQTPGSASARSVSMPAVMASGVSRERPGLVDRPRGRDELHDLSAAAIRADGEPASDHLAERRQVRRDPVQALRAARMNAEAGHDLVEHEERSLAAGDAAEAFEETVLRQHETHVPRDRLDDDGRDLVRERCEELLDVVEVVVVRRERVGHRLGRHSRRVREPERDDARAGLDEEVVGVPVVAARELHDLRPLRERSREPQRTHRRLGAGVDEADQLDARHRLLDEPRQLDLERARRAVARALADGLLERRNDARMGVAEDERAPREDVVDVPVPVDVDEVRALTPVDEERRPPDRLERPDRRADAAGHEPGRLGEQPLGLRGRALHPK